MSGSTQDRTERATPKRLREAREKGQLPRSRELTTALLVGTAVAVLMMAGAGIAAGAVQLMRHAFDFGVADLQSAADLPFRALRALREGLWLVAPVLLLGLAVALVAPLLLGGWNFSPSVLLPDFARTDPLAGLGRMFSGRTLVELLNGLLKVGVLGVIAVLTLWNSRQELLGLSSLSVGEGLSRVAASALYLVLMLSLGLLAIAALDVPYQLWKNRRELRMSKQEIREEFKQSEGRPEVKSRIRQAQQALSRRRMMQEVPKADVVVTNPTHYAVALRYSAGKMRAPRVVAKGADLIAQHIRELAREHRVPIVSAPPLARALYRSAELEQEIPTALYQAVAQVLTYVYQLRNWRGGSKPPALPEVGEVPGGEAD